MSRRRDYSIEPTESEAKGRDPQYVVALERGFDILRAFGEADADLSNTEITERTGLSKPTVSRLTNTLTRLGYLAYAERTGTYSLAAGLIALAAPLLSTLSIRERARPLMRELAEQSGASVAIAAPAGARMTYVEHVPGSGALVLKFSFGSQMPMERTAMGRAYLAALDADAFARTMTTLQSEGVLTRKIERGITAANESVQRDGFCISLGDWRPEIHAVAVPLRFPGGTPLALNCGAPSFVLSESTMREQIGPRLVEITRDLGADQIDRAGADVLA
ncbi:MAG: IclR family transcriptional regulator [Pseudomonadota bacterium]